MSRGTPLGAMRGPYRQHTRRSRLTDDMVRYIRTADLTRDELRAWLLAQGVAVELATIVKVRRRQRKAAVPD